MTLHFSEYFPIFILFLVSLILGSIIFGLSFLVATQEGDSEKLSAYECGFDPFDDARSQFDIGFYLVAILFIIFDLEVTFLFPWSICLGNVGFYGYWSMFIFLIILCCYCA